MLGNFQKAIDYHELHLEIAKQLGDKTGESGASSNLGIAHQSLGNLKKAIDYFELHLKLAESLEDRAGVAQCYGRLGNAYHIHGDLHRAIECYERCLKVANDRTGLKKDQRMPISVVPFKA